MNGHPERRFYFSLARELGMTVTDLLARTTSSEITEWIAYFRLEDAERENLKSRQQLMDDIRGKAGR